MNWRWTRPLRAMLLLAMVSIVMNGGLAPCERPGDAAIRSHLENTDASPLERAVLEILRGLALNMSFTVPEVIEPPVMARHAGAPPPEPLPEPACFASGLPRPPSV